MNSTATIYNQLGEQILVQEITSEKTDVDVRHLSNGIYFLKIEGLDNSFTQKMVIQR